MYIYFLVKEDGKMNDFFNITVDCTGPALSEVEHVVSRIDEHLKVQYGRWLLERESDSCKVMVDGEICWRLSEYMKPVEKHEYDNYAYRLITPQLKLKQVKKVRRVMDDLYSAGCVVLSPGAVKFHFRQNKSSDFWQRNPSAEEKYSEKKASRILEELVPGNRLLYTLLFFPSLMAPVCVPERIYSSGDSGAKRLHVAMLENYRDIINGIYQSDNRKLIDQLVLGLMVGRTKPLSNLQLNMYIEDETEARMWGDVLDDGTCCSADGEYVGDVEIDGDSEDEYVDDFKPADCDDDPDGDDVA